MMLDQFIFLWYFEFDISKKAAIVHEYNRCLDCRRYSLIVMLSVVMMMISLHHHVSLAIFSLWMHFSQLYLGRSDEIIAFHGCDVARLQV